MMTEKRRRRRRRRRTTTTTTIIKDLSNDMMVEILSCLPLSSIVRCRDVCKRWRSLITSCPSLLNKTINVACKRKKSADCRSYYYQNRNPRSDLEYMCLERGQRGGMQQISELCFSIDYPCVVLPEYRRLISCNGLLFTLFVSTSIFGRSSTKCYMSNPWTKESVLLPNPTKSSHYFLMGLAYENNPDPRIITNSSSRYDNNNVALYKIVMGNEIIVPLTKVAPNHNSEYLHKFEFEIYSSDKKRWQFLECAAEFHPCYIWHFLPGIAAYCNRVCYWSCPVKAHALMFNLETETSGYLDLPQDEHEVATYDRMLTACGGHLHYIRMDLSSRPQLTVWKMSITTGGGGDVGWLKLHKVDLQGLVEKNMSFFLDKPHPFSRTSAILDMCCQGEDKVLFMDNSNRIVSCDLKTGEFELLLQNDPTMAWEVCFRYTPTAEFIIDRRDLQGGNNSHQKCKRTQSPTKQKTTRRRIGSKEPGKKPKRRRLCGQFM